MVYAQTPYHNMLILHIMYFFYLQSHEIHNLETYTQYLVSLQVFNPEGPGPATTVLVMTDDGGKYFIIKIVQKEFFYFIFCQ